VPALHPFTWRRDFHLQWWKTSTVDDLNQNSYGIHEKLLPRPARICAHKPI
jgi:hypothetical protein